jgi:ornithine cyclodeaminase/alanine dehydrogenase-like protein (mu-crystallin family)
VLILNDHDTGYPFACLESSIISATRTAALAADWLSLSADSAAGFCGYLERSGTAGRITVHDGAEQLLRASDLVVFATVAGRPHVSDLSWFEYDPLVLHVSLRDLAPEIVLASTNIVDDVEHCLKADTSPHLAEQLTGNRDFLHGTLDDVMAGRVTPPAGRPLVFSPFGLGVLDLAVGKYVYDEVVRSGELRVVDDFFSELGRYGRG